MKVVATTTKEMLLFLNLEPQNDIIWSLAFHKIFKYHSQFSNHFSLIYLEFYNFKCRLKTKTRSRLQ